MPEPEVPAKSKECDILSFSVPNAIGVHIGTATITVVVPDGYKMTSVVPEIEISAKAKISPEAKVAQNFSSPVTYTVTAEDGLANKKYVVTVTDALKNYMVHTFDVAGWFSLRAVSGVIKKYVSGGVCLGLDAGELISINVDKGYTGFYDKKSGILKLYTAKGVEATSSDIEIEFNAILMKE